MDEIPDDPELIQSINNGERANIVEGYVINDVEDEVFNFYSEVNINNSRLWSLFESLVSIMPSEVSLVFNHVDADASFSEYANKLEILNELKPLSNELTKDGFLEFGLIYKDEDELIEVFIKKSKYIQFWGMDIEAFTNIMSKFSLKKVENLKFIDEFPMVTESLKIFEPTAIVTSEVIDVLHKIFSR